MINQRFHADRKGSVLSMKDLDTDRSEQCIILDRQLMRKLLRWLVDNQKIFMWEQECMLIPTEQKLDINLLNEIKDSDMNAFID